MVPGGVTSGSPYANRAVGTRGTHRFAIDACPAHRQGAWPRAPFRTGTAGLTGLARPADGPTGTPPLARPSYGPIAPLDHHRHARHALCPPGSAQRPIKLTDPHVAHTGGNTHLRPGIAIGSAARMQLRPSLPVPPEIDQTPDWQGLSTASQPAETRGRSRIRTIPPEKSHLSSIVGDPRHSSESTDLRGLTAQPIPKSLTFAETSRSPKHVLNIPKNLTSG